MELETLLHTFCAFYRDGKLDIGWVKSIQKGKLIIQPTQAREQFLPLQRILWSSQQRIPPTEKAENQLQVFIRSSKGLLCKH